jgi:predicted glycogen debranching enzyme
MHTRRYHGLFVAALQPPVERMVLLSRLDETIARAEERIELGCCRFPGTVSPSGHLHLISFVRDLFPIFVYEALGVRLRKRIGALHHRNAVLIEYSIERTDRAFSLELRPFLAGRGIHELRRVSETDARLLPRHAQFDGSTLRTAIPGIGDLEIRIFAPRADFTAGPSWWYRFQYDEERERGYDFEEDLWTPGLLSVPAFAGDRFTVMVSLGASDAMITPTVESDPQELWKEEEARRRELLVPGVDAGSAVGELVLAADQFVVRRGRGRTIIAGYPWFADWGRDAMIALPGLCLVTGRHAEAREILATFVEQLDGGLIPNRFLESGEPSEYNAADASLWLFWSVYKYLQCSGDARFVRVEMLPALRAIVAAYVEGVRFGIRVDADGLLRAGEPGIQLTWMDAKVGDQVITPRIGKPVEVNALWLNALFVLAELENLLGDERGATELQRRFRGAKRTFRSRFWNPNQKCLYDLVDGPAGDDASIRPNQVFALSLVTPLLSTARSRQVLSVIESKLVTPYGLRTLAPDDPAYRGVYRGDPASRDASYHQGTVWPWLAGPYACALGRFGGRNGRARARAYLDRVASRRNGLCVGTLPELFDGDPPHAARGAVAQAWSVGEWLRAWFDDVVDEDRSQEGPMTEEDRTSTPADRTARPTRI